MFATNLKTLRPSGRRRAAVPIAAFVSVCGTVLTAAPATDWPQLLGPQRNGVCAGPTFVKTWLKAGPSVVWKREVG